MRILMAWDDADQAELLTLYLSAGDNEAVCVSTAAEVLTHVDKGGWDVLLLASTLPTLDDTFNLFEKLQFDHPEMAVVLACRQAEMMTLPRFLTRGLRFYLVRDGAGDFVFLVLSCLESAWTATRAEESRKLAEKLREEMDGVRRLQESIIPKGLKAPAGYEIVARYEPAQVAVMGGQPVVLAGGDYYDLFCPDNRTLVVILGDAAGHGLKACMSIMTMHTLIRMFTGDQFRDTAKLVAEVNNRLCENSIVQSGGGFITLFYAAIDTEAHTMTWTSAGHPLAILQDLGNNSVVQIGDESDGGLPLGIAANMDYTAGVCSIPPNSRVLLYTDGLTDAFPQGSTDGFKAFGVPGIHESMRGSQAQDTAESLDRLFKASEAFTGGTGRHDDTSAVVLDRRPLG